LGSFYFHIGKIKNKEYNEKEEISSNDKLETSDG